MYSGSRVRKRLHRTQALSLLICWTITVVLFIASLGTTTTALANEGFANEGLSGRGLAPKYEPSPLTDSAMLQTMGRITEPFLNYESAPFELRQPAPTPLPQSAPINGTFTTLVRNIPPDWRRFGPHTTHAMSEVISDLFVPLALTPDGAAKQPALASIWQDDPDNHRIVFRIDNRAVWSDGVPVTASDLVHTLFYLTDATHGTFYQAHWLSEVLTGITVFAPQLFALHYPATYSEAPSALFDIRPSPAHHDLTSNSPGPVTGPYAPKSLTDNELQLVRLTPWWGNQIPAFRNRFHLQQIRYRRANTAGFRDFAMGAVDCIDQSSRDASPGRWANGLSDRYRIVPIRLAYRHPPGVTVVFPATTDDDTIRATQQHLLAPQEVDAPWITIDYPAIPEFAWMSASEAGQPLTTSALHNRLRTGHFQAALLTHQGRELPELRFARSNMQLEPFRLAALYDIPYHHYACWSWVTLPSPNARGDQRLSPTDLTEGGRIGLDLRAKARILNSPERPNGELPEPVYYPAN